MRKSKRAEHAEEAAERFMQALCPDAFGSRHNVLVYKEPLRKAWTLTLAAFRLYEIEWDCHDHDIREWDWPHRELSERRPFANDHAYADNPWTVLLRHAVAIVRGCAVRPRTRRRQPC